MPAGVEMRTRRATVPSATVVADDNRGTSTPARLWREVEPAIRLVSATVIIGAAAGALIGGVGGRIAMRVLMLTSDDTVRGLQSDDDFEIGRFTLANTIALLIITDADRCARGARVPRGPALRRPLRSCGRSDDGGALRRPRRGDDGAPRRDRLPRPRARVARDRPVRRDLCRVRRRSRMARQRGGRRRRLGPHAQLVAARTAARAVAGPALRHRRVRGRGVQLARGP